MGAQRGAETLEDEVMKAAEWLEDEGMEPMDAEMEDAEAGEDQDLEPGHERRQGKGGAEAAKRGGAWLAPASHVMALRWHMECVSFLSQNPKLMAPAKLHAFWDDLAPLVNKLLRSFEARAKTGWARRGMERIGLDMGRAAKGLIARVMADWQADPRNRAKPSGERLALTLFLLMWSVPRGLPPEDDMSWTALRVALRKAMEAWGYKASPVDLWAACSWAMEMKTMGAISAMRALGLSSAWGNGRI